MFTEGALRIEVHRAGRVVVLDLQSEQALVGSGAHCDVRLAPDEAAVEQLIIEAVDEEVFARTRTLDPPCLLNGAPFLEGRLLPTSMLELGSVVIRASFAQREHATAKRVSSSSTPPAVQAVGLLAVALGLYFMLHKPGMSESAMDAYAVDPPALASRAVSCPQSDPTAAGSLAELAFADAESKRERSPFFPGDGLTAIELFERAAACYERAARDGEARDAHKAASGLRAQLNDELHLRHVRLERFLAQDRYDDARREAELVSELVPDKQHEYAHWLSALKREGALRANRGSHR
jgi:hypothetical protein